MLRVFRYVDDKSDKLWLCRAIGNNRYEVWYGRTGKRLTHALINGSMVVKVDEKIRKGYAPVDGQFDEVNRLFTLASATFPPAQPSITPKPKPTKRRSKPKPLLEAKDLEKVKSQAGFF